MKERIPFRNSLFDESEFKKCKKSYELQSRMLACFKGLNKINSKMVRLLHKK